MVRRLWRLSYSGDDDMFGVLLQFSASSVISILIFHVYHYIGHDAMPCCIEPFPIVSFALISLLVDVCLPMHLDSVDC